MFTNPIRKTVRLLHTSVIRYSAAEKSPLFVLRQRTGIAYSLCREALNKYDNNVNEAEAWLKAQALARGLQKATKVRGRSTREGLVGLAIHQNNRVATVLELNCETDFVARNQIFKDFALRMTEKVASMWKDCATHHLPDQNHVEELRPPIEQIKSFDAQIVPLIATLGENIRIQKAFHLQAVEKDTQLFGRIHSMVAKNEAGEFDVTAGRFGAIVTLKDLSHTVRSLQNVGNRLCQHVIGYNPTYIELPDDIRKHLEAAEKEGLETKMKEVEGEVDEGEEQRDEEEESLISSKNSRDDWPSIMDQVLIMSDDLTVRDFCNQNNISIVHFGRFECGDSAE